MSNAEMADISSFAHAHMTSARVAALWSAVSDTQEVGGNKHTGLSLAGHRLKVVAP